MLDVFGHFVKRSSSLFPTMPFANSSTKDKWASVLQKNVLRSFLPVLISLNTRWPTKYKVSY